MARPGLSLAAFALLLAPLPGCSLGGESSNGAATAPIASSAAEQIFDVRRMGAIADGRTDDTAVFQDAVEEASTAEGVVWVPRGTYALREVRLVSNVTVRIEAGTTLMVASGAEGNEAIFLLAGDGNASFVENVAVVGVGGSFTIDLSQAPTPRNHGFTVKNVRHFEIANVKGIQNDSNRSGEPPSSYAALITFRATPASRSGGPLYHPVDGTINNVRTTSSPYGFGATQVTSGERLRFLGITSVGGIALRLETDGRHPSLLRHIRASGVHCRRGHAAVSFSPHGQHNADVSVSDVSAVGCESGIDLGGATGTGSGGRFVRSSVDGARVTAGAKAQLGEGEGAWTVGHSRYCVQVSPTARYTIGFSRLVCSGAIDPLPGNRRP